MVQRSPSGPLISVVPAPTAARRAPSPRRVDPCSWTTSWYLLYSMFNQRRGATEWRTHGSCARIANVDAVISNEIAHAGGGRLGVVGVDLSLCHRGVSSLPTASTGMAQLSYAMAGKSEARDVLNYIWDELQGQEKAHSWQRRPPQQVQELPRLREHCPPSPCGRTCSARPASSIGSKRCSCVGRVSLRSQDRAKSSGQARANAGRARFKLGRPDRRSADGAARAVRVLLVIFHF